uniref:Prostaglandin E synthase 2 n=1 Tax=Mantoniella antarctica TaxID=81844 RepID=A0A7S0X380_9CHLO
MHSTARTLGRRIVASAPRALVAVEAPGAAAGGGALTRGFARGYAASSCAAAPHRPFAARAATAGSLFAASAAFVTAAHLADRDGLPQTKAADPKVKLPFESVTLYQYDVCPFCNKVKAMLDFHGIPYDVVEVNPLTKSEIKFSEYKKVPVLVIDGEQLNDSSHIIATLNEKMCGAEGKGMRKGAEAEKEVKWGEWVDTRFVHVVTPNIYRTMGEAWRSFDYITERGNFGFFTRYLVRVSGAVSMYLISQNVLKKRHGIVDERAALYACLEDWMDNAVGKGAFCGGNAPNTADIAVFGVLRAVKTFETFVDAMEHTNVGPWYKRMEKEVGCATRTDAVEN